ncbi:tRNA (N6-threonylcarbamoyladenosine(37)-N6)-methyltransferase TrmO [Desulforhopalus singaporensis]|uniref:tRNA-Thr(GGU) m(6)t(6)A37 methyltransferase TsaA n=1 Tax=Desulforhopalus singaporensis TaxID=91360 RepID=A0A1H0SZ39_9BACT|nr:tRNA (N6-threonylcarbamoyladenosine(37)-N6)-methyltransferase TrmO [Desulforhopalus singaporensis]SDP47122.1 tRNA-Thr(GGU) m(6)t(6)A37 methyltransferase TsaA [Desulforhopalus singaporensis]
MIEIKPIGVIHTPYTKLTNMPIQPKGAKQATGTVEVSPEYAEGLEDLDGFSHIYLLYSFHKAKKTALRVIPFMDENWRGVFSTRSPLRPNHIGMSVVELVGVDKTLILVRGIDVLDGTPLLDIKPYIAAFDEVKQSRSGWMTKSAAEVESTVSDDRFIK